jgi:hypothetical protein
LIDILRMAGWTDRSRDSGGNDKQEQYRPEEERSFSKLIRGILPGFQQEKKQR